MPHAAAGAPAVRAQFGAAGDGVVLHRWHSVEEHSFERLVPLSALVDAVLALAPPGATPGEPRQYGVPHAIMAALAQTPPLSEEALRARLAGAGILEADARALLQAGLAPVRQSVFLATGLRSDRLEARGLMWFSDTATSWLITNFDDAGQVTLQTAGEADVRRAVAAVLATATQAAP